MKKMDDKKEITTIQVSKETQIKLAEIKYKMNFKDYDELISYLLKLLHTSKKVKK